MVLETTTPELLKSSMCAKRSAPSSAGTGRTPIAYLNSLPDASLDDLVETIIAWSHEVLGAEEIVAATERFHLDAGKVFHDDPFYNSRINYCLDHFLFERQVTGRGLTPFLLFMDRFASELPADLRRRLAALADHRHSLFRIVKLLPTSMVIEDLLQPSKLSVVARRGETFRGLEKKVMFQGFVFRDGDVWQLSHGIVLHPSRAQRLIAKFLKLTKKTGEFASTAWLWRLASLQIRHLRHRHVDPKVIYGAPLTSPR